jgi:CheY-like chemotaxis protein
MFLKRLLCVDDDERGLHVRKLVLEATGYQVCIASCGSSAMSIFRRQQVDCVVLDYVMPGVTGKEVAVQMKRLRPYVPIVLFTSMPALPDDIWPFVDRYVEKASGPRALIEAVASVLAQGPRAGEHRPD